MTRFDQIVRIERARTTAREILQRYIRRGGVFHINIRITEADLRQFLVNVVASAAAVPHHPNAQGDIVDYAFRSLMEKRTHTPGMDPNADPL